jgi:hypothetical protein
MSMMRPPGLEERAGGLDWERPGGVEDDVEPPLECGRVEAEVDDRDDAEGLRVLSRGGTATASHRGAVYPRDLGGGPADPAEAAVDEDALAGPELALADSR